MLSLIFILYIKYIFFRSCIGGVNSVDSQSNNANLKKSLVHNTAPTKSDISYPPRQLRSGKGKTTSERSPDSTEGVKRRKIMSDSSEEEILEASTSFSHSLSELKAASTSKKESPMKTGILHLHQNNF